MKKLIYPLFVVLLSILVSCSKEDDQAASPATQQSSSVDKVSYSEQIVPLKRKSCNASNCHNVFTTNTLTSGRMMSSAHNGTLSELLAKGDKSSCRITDPETIATLQAWISQGAPME